VLKTPKKEWRVTEWHKRYIAAATNYAFFCEQSSDENDAVARTIHKKEGMEAQKAAIRGVQDATHKQRELESKTAAKTKEKTEKDKAAAHEDRQKHLIRMMADKARFERLRSYPQSSVHLLGFVADASTGKGILGVNITSKCPFDTYTGTTTAYIENSGFSKYLTKNGITGPEGYRCELEYAAPGYISLQFHILIARQETQSAFRHAMLMPNLATPPPYRIVLQYSNMPADIDAHLQVYADGQSTYDISGHRPQSTAFQYLKNGKADEYPFVTMDANTNNGYGPESHTIHVPQVGTYGYYVMNYDHHFTDNLKFHDSDARVFVYKGNELLHRYAIRNAMGSPAKYWQVFSMTCTQPAGEVTCTVDEIGAFVKSLPLSANIVTKAV